jgi:hypothetical protein
MESQPVEKFNCSRLIKEIPCGNGFLFTDY